MTQPRNQEPGRERIQRGRQAPAIHAGWTIGPPDFIGVGVHKAGTTWWWALLAAHPDVDGVPRRKELHLLERMRGEGITQDQIGWYHRQFPRAPGHLAGEWTPRYMAMPALPPIISQVAPDAKLLAILREPIERYRSGLKQWHEQTRRRSLRRDESKGKREALMRGFYGRQVQRLQEAVGRDRILVLQYERCVEQPEVEFARTLDFLQLAAYEPPPELLRSHFNRTIGDKGRLSGKDEAGLVAEYEPEVALLKKIVPEIDLSLWPRFAHAAGGP